VQLLPRDHALAALAGAQLHEVAARPGQHVSEELEHDPAQRVAADRDVHPHARQRAAPHLDVGLLGVQALLLLAVEHPRVHRLARAVRLHEQQLARRHLLADLLVVRLEPQRLP